MPAYIKFKLVGNLLVAQTGVARTGYRIKARIDLISLAEIDVCLPDDPGLSEIWFYCLSNKNAEWIYFDFDKEMVVRVARAIEHLAHLARAKEPFIQSSPPVLSIEWETEPNDKTSDPTKSKNEVSINENFIEPPKDFAKETKYASASKTEADSSEGQNIAGKHNPVSLTKVSPTYSQDIHPQSHSADTTQEEETGIVVMPSLPPTENLVVSTPNGTVYQEAPDSPVDPPVIRYYYAKVGQHEAIYEIVWTGLNARGQYAFPADAREIIYNIEGTASENGYMTLTEYENGKLSAHQNLEFQGYEKGEQWTGAMDNVTGNDYDMSLSEITEDQATMLANKLMAQRKSPVQQTSQKSSKRKRPFGSFLRRRR